MMFSEAVKMHSGVRTSTSNKHKSMDWLIQYVANLGFSKYKEVIQIIYLQCWQQLHHN